MRFFRLSALALATTLALTGCGGDGDGSSSTSIGDDKTPSTPTQPPVQSGLSELDQAKEMIRTAHLFVSDSHTVETAYEGASDILTNKQQSRVSAAFDTPENIFSYMEEFNVNKLTSADIIKLQTSGDNNFLDSIYPLNINPSSDFVAELNSDGQFTLTGTAELIDQEFDYPYPYNKPVLVSSDKFVVSYNDYENALTTHTSTLTPELRLGFQEIKIGSGDDQVVLSSATKGAKLNGTLNKAVVLDDDFDISVEHDKGTLIEKAIVTLKDLKLVANDSVVQAKDFEIAAMDISNKLADGSTVIRTIPYKLALTGKLQKETPKTDVQVTLNMTAKEKDIKNSLTIDQNDHIDEKAGKYVGMTVMLSLKGNVTKQGSTTIPLDLQAHLERSAREEISLKGLTASVEGKTLFIEGQSDLDEDYDVIKTQLTVKQNNAYIKLNMDANGDFIVDNSGKLGDIMVGNKDYGDLFDNNGKITARFSDNSIITL